MEMDWYSRSSTGKIQKGYKKKLTGFKSVSIYQQSMKSGIEETSLTHKIAPPPFGARYENFVFVRVAIPTLF
jgi:hypothetical protein